MIYSPEDKQLFGYMSPDGSRVILATAEPFDPADTDTQVDLYESVGGTFQLLTTGATGGNGPFPLGHVDFSLDGSRVLFETNEALVPEDRDFLQDVYEHSGGVTQLVSVGDFAGSGVFNAYLRDVSEDGTRAFFSTAETLIAEDGDGGYMDVFKRAGGDTELISTGPDPAGSHDATFNDASADGSRVVFTTKEPLVSQDTDVDVDLYERAAGVTTLISIGPVDGPGNPFDPGAAFSAAARFGGRVIFRTSQQLVAEDSDTGPDLYARAAGATTLVSTGPTDDGGGSAIFLSASEDASVVLFRTNEPLVPEHTSGSQIGYYRRAGSQTDLIVTYPPSNLTSAPLVLSGDGSHVFYTTKSPHVPEDLDGDADVYGWHDGVTELISTGPGDTHTTWAAGSVVSFDGERVFFYSHEPLVPGDPDGTSQDVFERSGGTTYQISPPGFGPADSIVALSRDGARLLLSSSRPLVPADTDGTQRDIYLFSGSAPFGSMSAPPLLPAAPPPPPAGATQASATAASPSTGNGRLAIETLSTVGERRIATVEPDGTGFQYVTGEATFNPHAPAWSPDGARLAFWSGNFTGQGSRIGTVEPDGDNRTWMSESSQFFGASYPAWSPDGQTIAFAWESSLSSCAGIATTRVDGTESRIILPPAHPCVKQDLDWSPDGERIVLSAREYGSPDDSLLEIYSLRPDGTDLTRLTNEETHATNPDWAPDGSAIAYQIDPASFQSYQKDIVRIDPDGSNRTLLSAGSSPAWSPDRGELAFVRSSPLSNEQLDVDSLYLDAPGGRHIFHSSDQIVDIDWQPVPGGQKGYPRPKGASPVRFSLVPAYYQCAEPNRTHGPALSFPSCNPPTQGSDHLTVGTADSNGQPTLFNGFLRLHTLTGNPSTPADEADVSITASLLDVRCRAAIAPCAGGPLSDYTGSLRARFVVRITDRLNALGHAITTQDLPLTAPIACAATPSSAGSDCTAATTLEAIVPGVVPEGKRSNWQLDQVTIFDGGSDGDPGTGVNTPFAVPGIFIP